LEILDRGHLADIPKSKIQNPKNRSETVQATIYNLQGQAQDTVELNDAIFGIEPNEGVVHQAVLRQLANARLGTHNTLTRADVRGGGRKPWRQTGRGRARQGSTRAPQWRHGGVVFGPHPRSYEQDLPRKMRRLAMRSVLSDKAAQGRILLIDTFDTLEPRTKALISALAALNLSDRKILVMTPGRHTNLDLASGNLTNITRMHTHFLNVVEMLKAEFLIIDRASIDVIESILGQTGGRMSRPVTPPAVAPARLLSPLETVESAPVVAQAQPSDAVAAPEVVTVAPQAVATTLDTSADAADDAADDEDVDPDLVPEEMGEDRASGTGAWDEADDEAAPGHEEEGTV
jgi:large subunit ribosomal protein L4